MGNALLSRVECQNLPAGGKVPDPDDGVSLTGRHQPAALWTKAETHSHVVRLRVREAAGGEATRLSAGGHVPHVDLPPPAAGLRNTWWIQPESASTFRVETVSRVATSRTLTICPPPVRAATTNRRPSALNAGRLPTFASRKSGISRPDGRS